MGPITYVHAVVLYLRGFGCLLDLLMVLRVDLRYIMGVKMLFGVF